MAKKYVVYTACFGSRDNPVKFIPTDEREVDYVCFTDRKVGKLPQPWQVRKPAFEKIVKPNDHRRLARLHKAVPHILFPQAEVTVWVDCHGYPIVTVEDMVKQYLADHEVAVFAHQQRVNIEQEAKTVIQLGMDNAKIVNAAVERYIRMGMPRNARLAETPALIRANTDRTALMNSHWLYELMEHSIRDQISFPYCAWRAGLQWKELRGGRRKSPDFKLKR